MTISEMHLMYKLLLDKIDSEAYPDILPEEIDLFLNLAQERFVKQRYGLVNNIRKSFEETRKRTDDLKMVVKDFNYPLSAIDYNSINTITNTYQVSYSSIPDHWFTLRQMVLVENTPCVCEPCLNLYNVREHQTDDWIKVKTDPFNKPALEYPISVSRDYIDIDFGQQIDFTQHAITFQVRYIAKPVPVDSFTVTNCLLSDHTHQEIVELAVNITLETIESVRFQSQKSLNLEQE